jgi:hypothetical protein
MASDAVWIKMGKLCDATRITMGADGQEVIE